MDSKTLRSLIRLLTQMDALVNVHLLLRMYLRRYPLILASLLITGFAVVGTVGTSLVLALTVTDGGKSRPDRCSVRVPASRRERRRLTLGKCVDREQQGWHRVGRRPGGALDRESVVAKDNRRDVMHHVKEKAAVRH